MFGIDNTYNALNTSAITDLLTVHLGQPALYKGFVLPDRLPNSATSINVYLIGPTDPFVYWENRVSINCRAKTEKASRDLAQTVYNNVNRKQYNGYYLTMSVGQVIPPADKTDNYNTPIEARILER